MGAIFVLLDGVLILTESAELWDQWAARLKRNETLADVERKVTNSGALGSTFTCTSGAGKCAEEKATVFGGVRLAPEGVEPAVSTDGLSLPENPTWRQVASVLGNALWRLRVMNAAIHPGSSAMPLLREQLFLRLWSLIGSEVAASEAKAGRKAWDKPASPTAMIYFADSTSRMDAASATPCLDRSDGCTTTGRAARSSR